MPRRSIFAALFAATAMIAAAGCANKPPRDSGLAATRPTFNRDGNVVWSKRRDIDYNERLVGGIQQHPTLVTEGATPLVYIFDLGGPLRVVDLTSKVVIATAVAPPRSLVRIDERHGVTVGRENVLPGPLPAGRRYGIYLEPQTDNRVNQSTTSGQIGAPR